MKLIISTCGTSTLTNLADDASRKLVTKYANVAADTDVPLDDRKPLLDLLGSARDTLKAADILSTKRASAELNGILSLAGDHTPLDSRDVHILLHTDTWLGTAAAEIVESTLINFGASPQLERVASLSTRSRDAFDDGLRHLVKWAAETLPGYRDARYKILFNLVGGFKSVQGFMQTLGMFYADEIVYIFESGSELLRIPRLPVDLDSAAQKIMTDHARVFRRLDILGPQPFASNLANIPESMLERADDIADLSPWGKLIWNAFKPALYGMKLLDSPSDRIRFTDAFARDAAGLERDRFIFLNQRIDDLMRYLESADKPNPKRLDVKKLTGKPMPRSTHEADAWADADCRRIFFHHEGDAIVLDRLQSPLH
jgi:putative CRISPR-associated protein (TIGR02619 family)